MTETPEREQREEQAEDRVQRTGRRIRRNRTTPPAEIRERSTERPVDSDGFAVRDATIVFIGDSQRPRRNQPKRRVRNEGIHAMYQFQEGPLKGEWFVVRGETCTAWKRSTLYQTNLVWGGREKNILIAKPSTTPLTQAQLEEGYEVPEEAAPITVIDPNLLEIHTGLKTDDGRPAFKYGLTGALVFLAHDMDKLGHIDSHHPVYLTGTRGTYWLATRNKAAIGFLREYGGRNASHHDWIKSGGLWMRPINPETFEVGWYNPERERWELHKLTPIHQILGLPNGLPKIEELESAKEKTVRQWAEQFGPNKQRILLGRIPDDKHQNWVTAYGHNLERLEIACQIQRQIIEQHEAASQAIAAAPNPRQRKQQMQRGQVEVPKQLAAATRAATYEESRESWRAVVEAALSWTNLNAEDWGGYLAGAWLAYNRHPTLSSEADTDDVVFEEVISKTELPELYWPYIIRYVRVTLQGAKPEDYPVSNPAELGVTLEAGASGDYTLTTNGEEEKPIGPEVLASFQRLFKDRRIRVAAAPDVASALGVTVSEANKLSDNQLREKLEGEIDANTVSRIIRAIRQGPITD